MEQECNFEEIICGDILSLIFKEVSQHSRYPLLFVNKRWNSVIRSVPMIPAGSSGDQVYKERFPYRTKRGYSAESFKDVLGWADRNKRCTFTGYQTLFTCVLYEYESLFLWIAKSKETRLSHPQSKKCVCAGHIERKSKQHYAAKLGDAQMCKDLGCEEYFKCSHLKMAIRREDFEILDWLVILPNFSICGDNCTNVARKGRTDLLEWMEKRGAIFDFPIISFAAAYGQKETVIWLQQRNLELLESDLTVSFWNGNKDFVVWAITKNIPFDSDRIKFILFGILLNIFEKCDIRYYLRNDDFYPRESESWSQPSDNFLVRSLLERLDNQDKDLALEWFFSEYCQDITESFLEEISIASSQFSSEEPPMQRVREKLVRIVEKIYSGKTTGAPPKRQKAE